MGEGLRPVSTDGPVVSCVMDKVLRSHVSLASRVLSKGSKIVQREEVTGVGSSSVA